MTQERTGKLSSGPIPFVLNLLKALLRGWRYWLPWGGVTTISTMTSAIFALEAANTGTTGGEPGMTIMLAVIAFLFLTFPPALMAAIVNSLEATGRPEQPRDLKAKG